MRRLFWPALALALGCNHLPEAAPDVAPDSALGTGDLSGASCTPGYEAFGKPCGSVGAICADNLTYPCDCVGTPSVYLCCGDRAPPLDCTLTPGLTRRDEGVACCGNDDCYENACAGGMKLRCACANPSMTTFIGRVECKLVACDGDAGGRT